MSAQLISIYALVAMFVIATILPINMGVLAFVGAYLVGTLVAGQSTKDIIAGFPGGLFLTLVGITYLFAIAQNNGTYDRLARTDGRTRRARSDCRHPLDHVRDCGCAYSRWCCQPWCRSYYRSDRPRLCRDIRHQPASDG